MAASQEGNPDTRPKPFVFVLMPFDEEFQDTYELGIKAAANNAGAYAERLDDQLFDEGMLDRIFNQIARADVLIADMTGKNPNVFYEVGYAHALGKIVLLITRDAADIPFDLKHRHHIVYGGKIVQLRTELELRLKWALKLAEQGRGGEGDAQLVATLEGIGLPRAGSGVSPVITSTSSPIELTLRFQNIGPQTVEGGHILLLSEEAPPCVFRDDVGVTHFAPLPQPMMNPTFLHFARFAPELEAVPPYGVSTVRFSLTHNARAWRSRMRIRVTMYSGPVDFDFDFVFDPKPQTSGSGMNLPQR